MPRHANTFIGLPTQAVSMPRHELLAIYKIPHCQSADNALLSNYDEYLSILNFISV